MKYRPVTAQDAEHRHLRSDVNLAWPTAQIAVTFIDNVNLTLF